MTGIPKSWYAVATPFRLFVKKSAFYDQYIDWANFP